MGLLVLDSSSLAGNARADWRGARADYSSAFVRADFGTWIDTDFARQWAAIKAAGMIRGAYLLLRWDQDPALEAQAFARAVGELGPGDYPPCIDVEFGGPGRAATGLSAQQVIDRTCIVERHFRAVFGCSPMIYDSERVWHYELGNIGAPAELLDCPLWLARYIDVEPPVPAPWGAHNFWLHQFAGDVRIPGFPGVVDVSRFHVMQRGEAGERVGWVQRRLGVPATKSFDAATGAALVAFQLAHGLDRDEAIGPATFSRLAWVNPTS